MKFDSILELAASVGFTSFCRLDPKTLVFRSEVRAMCEENRCGNYNRSWSCPPACGSLEAILEKARTYNSGVILQTTGTLEDAYDYEGMMETGNIHSKNIRKFVNELRKIDDRFLPMGAGGCRICNPCTYPDTPCRFPDECITSMEAYGLVVSDTCRDNGIAYYYGPNTITYVGCILFNED